VVAYLSRILNRIKQQIDARYKYAPPRVFLNMAAPMDHYENAGLKNRYLQIVQAAWHLVFGECPFPVKQGMLLKNIEQRLLPWLEREVPELAARPFEVLPETAAPIVSLSLDPRMGPGMYMIIDMGAGTTEVSVNHVGTRDAQQKVLCYCDESIVFGGDNLAPFVNAALADKLREKKEKEQEELVQRFVKFYKRVWAKGYKKDCANHATRPRWRQLTVLLTGGGARHPKIEKAICLHCPIYAFPNEEVREHYKIVWHKPIGIGTPNRNGHELGEDASLLSVAHGLSMHRRQWPVVFTPDEIDQQEPTEVAEKPLGHWYAER